MSATQSNANHSNSSSSQFVNIPQQAPGAHAAVGHTVNNSIPLSIFPIAMDKFCICFAGLPARGKTHMTRRLARYLEFFHAIPVKVFNYNEYRRKKYGKVSNFFFDPTNVENMEKREIVYEEISAEVTQFMKSHPNAIAILDSTNATFKRRNALSEMIHATGAKMMFVEVQNNDAKSVEEHIHKIITGSPDYEGEIYDVAIADFKLKVDKYKSVYETIDSGKYPIESTLNYIKCDLQTGHFIIHNIRGYLQQKVAHFIMNLRTEPHIFYLSRHGQSEYNAIGRIGGDSGLSQHGMNYAKKLADFTENVITKEPIDDASNSSSGHNSSAALLALAAGAPGTSTWPGTGGGTGTGTGTETKECVENFISAGTSTANGAGASIFKTLMPPAERPARLWTSTMRRTKETAQFIKKSTMSIQDKHNPALVHEWIQMRPRAWHHLDELFAGSCDGMTYEEIEEQFPEEFARRSEDKLAYRYPRGESYLDVIARLEPMIIEMERHSEPLLIVGHQGILRIIYAFYMGLSRSDAPYVSIPLNTVIECKPGAFACEVRKHVLYKIELNDDGQNEPYSAGVAHGGDGAPAFPGDKQEGSGSAHDHRHGGAGGRRLGQEGSGAGASGDGGAGSLVNTEFGARKRATSAAPRYITEEEINNPHSH